MFFTSGIECLSLCVPALQYGQDGQDWLVAAASSDFNEILRLLKAHPELIRRKVSKLSNIIINLFFS
jgi:hypothetical protein